jgi:cysteinyl-tRNA synthetase
MGYDPLAFRYLALQARYRAKLNFSVDGLAGADRALRVMRERVAAWSREHGGSADAGADHAKRFRHAIADDLDLPAAMALVAEVGRADLPGGVKSRLLLDFDRVLGLDLGRETVEGELPAGAAELLERRERARAARDYPTSDHLRAELAALGVQVTDGPDRQQWKVVPRS